MILVTGGTGFVGAHMLLTLTCAGHRVKASYRSKAGIEYTKALFSYYKQENLFGKIQWKTLDLLNGYDVLKALTDVKQIYHCAAMVDLQSTRPEKLIANNTNITAQLIDAAIEQKVEAFCHVSSIASLGDPINGKPADESSYWTTSEKQSPYAISKFHSEMEVWRGHTEGLPVIIVNPSVIIGPARANSGSGLLFKQVWKGMPFYTDGSTGIVDVRDVTRAMLQLMEAKAFGQRFVLNAENLSYKQLFTHIAEALKKQPPKKALSKQWLKIGVSLSQALHTILPIVPKLSYDLVRTAYSHQTYSADKIRQEHNFSFTPAREMINQAAPFIRQQLINN